MDSARSQQPESSQATDLAMDLSRKDPIAARVLRRWRELSRGTAIRDDQRRTMVAFSGGADSTALSVILSLIDPKPVLVHIVHDLRSPDHTSADEAACEQIAKQLGCSYLTRSIQIKDQIGNNEANARRVRYQALVEIAQQEGVDYIATGHHADDQLETMLMNISRGCGVRGLAGIHDTRDLNGINLIRPMLVITHEEAVSICIRCGLEYVHDHTNDDESMTRNAIRHQLLPAMRDIDPEYASRATNSASSCRSTIQALQHLVKEHLWGLATLTEYSVEFERSMFSGQSDAAIVEVLFLAMEHLVSSSGLDRLNQQTLDSAVRVIKDSSTERRLCRVGPIVIEAHASKLIITSSEHAQDSSDSSKEKHQ
jgi:tRNA(Ile)-lysidine synthase